MLQFSCDGKGKDALKYCLRLLLVFCMFTTAIISFRTAGAEQSGRNVYGENVYSESTEISQNELLQIGNMADSISGKYTINNADIGVYIAVVDSYGYYGSDVEDAAYCFFSNSPYEISENGILLFFSIGDREYDVYTFGYEGEKVFNDYAVDDIIIDSIYDDLHNDRWSDALSHYLEKCDEVLKLAGKGRILSVKNTAKYKVMNWGISAIIALIIAIIVGVVLKNGMKSVAKKVEARNYVKEGSFNVSYRNDMYTHSTETRRKIEKSSSSGGSGGGSHHSGSF